jgi:hypothetical protein
LRNPQQQLEDRQHYERLNFERQQDEQLKSLMNQELNQQTQHASSTMGILQELDSFFVMLSRRLHGILHIYTGSISPHNLRRLGSFLAFNLRQKKN